MALAHREQTLRWRAPQQRRRPGGALSSPGYLNGPRWSGPAVGITWKSWSLRLTLKSRAPAVEWSGPRSPSSPPAEHSIMFRTRPSIFRYHAAGRQLAPSVPSRMKKQRMPPFGDSPKMVGKPFPLCIGPPVREWAYRSLFAISN